MLRTPPRKAARPPRTIALALPATSMHFLLRWLLALAACAAMASGLLAQVAININGNPPAGNALLDIQSTNKGLLIPRVTASQRISMATTDGLMVYQSDSLGQYPRGYWYYDSSTPILGWRHLAWGPKIWQLGGNAGTLATNFLGTTNNMPLLFRTNGADHGRITETGELQLYIAAAPAATELVQVEGGVKLTGTSAATNHEGTMRFVPGSGNTPGRFEGYVVNTPTANTTINGWKQLDNNFKERKKQESPIPGVGCLDPSNTSNTAAAVSATPRPWPSPGPTAFITLAGARSPYWTLWEDGRRQYLYQAADLAAAGICPGPSNPIRSIAFNATGVSGATGRIHFLRFRMKNTGAATTAAFDNVLLQDFAYPSPPNIAGPPPSYTAGHTTGYTVVAGWNVHPYDQGPGGFVWTGGNMLIDASLDNQDWGFIRDADVQGYNSIPQCSITMYCDACGNGGPGSCLWTNPAAGPVYYYPPTTPINGQPNPAGNNAGGWGYVGGWNLQGGISTVLCDGTLPNWSGSGPPTVNNQLPRVAFLCQYVGGGVAYNVESYMVAQEGVMIGDATWAASGTYPNESFRGPGTISAQRSVWSGNSLLSDYVFDLYYDGKAKPADAQGASEYLHTPLKELPNYVEQNRHLPTIEGRSAWERKGTFSVDQLTNQLWVTVEDQALYIKELNERMDALQQFLVEKKLKELGKGK